VNFRYRLPFGAELQENGLTRFRLWAPQAKTAAVQLDARGPVPMDALDDGWFELHTECAAGACYRYVLMTQQDGEISVPDPASRAQVADVHGDSIVVDPCAYVWQHPEWRGRPWHETVLYELHPGVMGGFAGITARLPQLAALGVTAVELMPVSEFPGPRNWGYDGVLPFAPDASYGTPAQLKQLIDTAHGLGLMVFLDVVYNHFGPDGNYLHSYAAPFFRDDQVTPWGAAIDFRRPQVSDYFFHNAVYWLQEYRFDGLRFDAAHAIGEQQWLQTLAPRIRVAIADADATASGQGGRRQVHLVLEHDDNAASLLDEQNGGVVQRYDAQWNDDGHHVLHVLLTGESGGYYSDYAEAPAAKLARCLQQGFIYQGQPSPYRDGWLRGQPSAQLPPTAFVLFLQNHDQTGNRAGGERLITLAAHDAVLAAQALVLLAPQIPMLFMGEEFGARQPFLYFTSHTDEQLAQAVRDGRRQEFARFPAFADGNRLDQLPDPNHVSTFLHSIPQLHTEPDPQVWVAWCTDLLRIRREQLMPGLPGARALDARAIGPAAVSARWQLGAAGHGAIWHIVVNLGAEPLREALEDLIQAAGADVIFDSGNVLHALAAGFFPAHAILVTREAAS